MCICSSLQCIGSGVDIRQKQKNPRLHGVVCSSEVTVTGGNWTMHHMIFMIQWPWQQFFSAWNGPLAAIIRVWETSVISIMSRALKNVCVYVCSSSSDTASALHANLSPSSRLLLSNCSKSMIWLGLRMDKSMFYFTISQKLPTNATFL